MDNPFGGTLSVKVSHFLDKLEILQKNRTAFASGQGVLGVSDRDTLICG